MRLKKKSIFYDIKTCLCIPKVILYSFIEICAEIESLIKLYYVLFSQ